MACYLVFDVASLGTLFGHWSEQPVDGALAVVTPTKNVPKFKFVQRGGRFEIQRDIRTNKKRLYQGWCEFFKIARDYEGTFTLLEDEVSVHLNKFGEVYNVPLGEEFAIQEYSAVAVAGKDSIMYDNVKTMPNGQFLGYIGGTSTEGATLSLI